MPWGTASYHNSVCWVTHYKSAILHGEWSAGLSLRPALQPAGKTADLYVITICSSFGNGLYIEVELESALVTKESGRETARIAILVEIGIHQRRSSLSPSTIVTCCKCLALLLLFQDSRTVLTKFAHSYILTVDSFLSWQDTSRAGISTGGRQPIYRILQLTITEISRIIPNLISYLGQWPLLRSIG